MATISAADMRFLDVTLQMTGGYCLDFSDRTFSGLFADAINYNIDHEDNFREGGSKGKRMRYWLRMADDRTAAKLLRAIWDYRADMSSLAYADPDPPALKPRFDAIVAKLEEGVGVTKTDAIDRFSADETLEELVAGIQRDVDAGRPETALDRLHTYCMKKLAHLLAQRTPEIRPAGTLNARLGQYLGTSRRDAKLHHPVSFKIMTGAIETFELFNGVRNDRSLAHDNTLIERSEATFIFNAIVNVLRFIKATEQQTFERVAIQPTSAAQTSVPPEHDDEIPL